MTSQKLPTESELIELKGFLSFLILHELKKTPLCGDDLAVNIGRRKGSRLTPGTIYPALKRLRKAKLLGYKRKGRKKMYSLTPLGHKEIDHLYNLFGSYFYGLKDKILKKPTAHKKHQDAK